MDREAYNRQYYIENKEKIKEQHKQYYLNNKESFLRRGTLWRLENKEKMVEYLSKDHIIPISKGGNNTRENIVPACITCNSSKGNKVLVGGIYAF